MNDETRKNLVDILQAIEEIQSFVYGICMQSGYKPLADFNRRSKRNIGRLNN